MLVMNIYLHSENAIQLCCYNVPVLAVLYELNRRVFIAKKVQLLIMGVTIPRLFINRTPLQDGQSGPVPKVSVQERADV